MSDSAVFGLMVMLVTILAWLMGLARRHRHYSELQAWSRRYPRSGNQGPDRVVP